MLTVQHTHYNVLLKMIMLVEGTIAPYCYNLIEWRPGINLYTYSPVVLRFAEKSVREL